MTLKSYFDSSDPILKDLKILNLFKIYMHLTSLLMIGYIYLENLPEVFENYFLFNKAIHDYKHKKLFAATSVKCVIEQIIESISC